MYADRHRTASAIDPRSLAIAVALNGAVIGALMLASPVLTVLRPEHHLTTYPVPLTPPPKPLPPPKEPVKPRIEHDPVATRPIVELPLQPPPIRTTDDVLPRPIASPDPGPVALPSPTPSPALVTIGPEVDPAHRGDLQPTYPDSELRAEREGVAVVRVLIGVDGRVARVEEVSATSDAFWRATRERALSRWRFRPATRGGVPVEAWRQMSIRFVIPR